MSPPASEIAVVPAPPDAADLAALHPCPAGLAAILGARRERLVRRVLGAPPRPLGELVAELFLRGRGQGRDGAA